MVESRKLFVSCEHAGNKIPPEYQELFLDQEEMLDSHYGYDPGALGLAKMLAKGMSAPLEKSEITRLLVDLNRSLHNSSLFSETVRELDQAEKTEIVEQYYLPYRRAVSRKISTLIAAGAQVVHLSVHSFTPNLRGRERNAELGLLYDPARKAEKLFSLNWQHLLQQRLPDMKIRCNYPYRGNADGLVRSLRTSFGQQDYLGIELEVNQALLNQKLCFPASLECGLLETLQEMFPTD